jgi:flagellar basal-body rod protein FlgB
MGLDDIPLFSMLKGKLGYVNQRQRLISENIANADTPGYAPRDLKAFSFAAMVNKAGGAVALARTDPAHLALGASHGAAGVPDAFKAVTTPDSETRLDGNQVVLEEEMSKMTQARVDYEAAIDFYQQSLNLISTAARAPGKSS